MIRILEAYDEKLYDTFKEVLEELATYLPKDLFIDTMEVDHDLIRIKGTIFFLQMIKEETPV